MPNYSKRVITKRQGRVNSNYAVTDFTVGDFADTKPSNFKSVRVKKGEIISASSLGGMDVRERVSDLPWDEKNLSDFEDVGDDNDPGSEEDEQNSISEVTQHSQKNTGTRKHNSRSKKPSAPDSCLVYPADLWYILGDYIDVEDAGRFAGICQGAHHVTHTVGFWRNLYYRYTLLLSDCQAERLPLALRPAHIDRVHGLRSRVIRAMYYVNPVFLNRLKQAPPFEHDPDLLRGCTCTLMFHQKTPRTRSHDSKWVFNFKFSKTSQNNNRLKCAYATAKDADFKKRRLSADDDIHVNSHDGVYILQVVCPNFMSLPSPMGLVLNTTSISVSSQGMSFHKLRLQFDQTLCSGGATETTLLIDPVLNVCILPWCVVTSQVPSLIGGGSWTVT